MSNGAAGFKDGPLLELRQRLDLKTISTGLQERGHPQTSKGLDRAFQRYTNVDLTTTDFFLQRAASDAV